MKLRAKLIMPLFVINGVLLIFIFGCKFETINPELSIQEPAFIKIGDHNEMLIKQYDTTIIGDYNFPINFNIDLNNDGVDDIQFECVVWGLPNVGSLPSSKIKIISNNIGVFGQNIIDSIYLHIDTSIRYLADNTVLIEIFNEETCTRKNAADQLQETTNSSNIFPLSINDTIDINDNYISDTALISSTAASWLSNQEINEDMLSIITSLTLMIVL